MGYLNVFIFARIAMTEDKKVSILDLVNVPLLEEHQNGETIKTIGDNLLIIRWILENNAS